MVSNDRRPHCEPPWGWHEHRRRLAMLTVCRSEFHISNMAHGDKAYIDAARNLLPDGTIKPHARVSKVPCSTLQMRLTRISETGFVTDDGTMYLTKQGD